MNKTGLVLLGVIVCALLNMSNAIAQTVASIGVSEFRFSEAGNSSEISIAEQETILKSISNKLNAALNGTRKFDIYNNTQLNERLTRQGLSLEAFQDKNAKGKKRFQSGLDYILTGSISKAGTFDRNSGEQQNTEGRVSLVDIEFSLLAASYDSIDFSSSSSSIIKFDSSVEGAEEQAMQSAVSAVSEDISKQVLSKLFPIRVIKVSNTGTVKLNYGSGSLKEGQQIRIFARSKKTDAKPKVAGIIKVLDSSGRFSTAQILEGEGKIHSGLIGELL